MKAIFTYAALLALLVGVLAGCGQQEEAEPTATTETETTSVSPADLTPVTVAYDLGSIKAGDQAMCVICAVDGGATEPEAVHDTIDYEGKTYAFCNETEKATFISDPAKYARTQ